MPSASLRVEGGSGVQRVVNDGQNDLDKIRECPDRTGIFRIRMLLRDQAGNVPRPVAALIDKEADDETRIGTAVPQRIFDRRLLFQERRPNVAKRSGSPKLVGKFPRRRRGFPVPARAVPGNDDGRIRRGPAAGVASAQRVAQYHRRERRTLPDRPRDRYPLRLRPRFFRCLRHHGPVCVAIRHQQGHEKDVGRRRFRASRREIRASLQIGGSHVGKPAVGPQRRRQAFGHMPTVGRAASPMRIQDECRPGLSRVLRPISQAFRSARSRRAPSRFVDTSGLNGAHGRMERVQKAA